MACGCGSKIINLSIVQHQSEAKVELGARTVREGEKGR